ncbi:MAG: ATP synthase F0 subunit B [Candidatus Syntrophonatronum acetioxidans]|uniref:ATP synthase subunit b n=1 Tax=Candidatus Syntrophonatronum acetioxidans TaxID=1795816 RepID=A0A424YFW8_9FIRM|nr:MAG: ATP synthase F0 subunit B [Candidatus Syntrophonatronum acetioxidans]
MVEFSIEYAFQLVNFVILYLLLRKLLYKPIAGYMEKRRDEIANSIEQAERDKDVARKTREKYEKQLQEAKKEASDIMARATKQGDEMINQSKAEAKKQGQNLIEQAKKEINLEKERAFMELRDEVGRLSVEIAEKILAQNIDHAAQEKLIKEYLDEVGGVQ